MTTHSLTTLPSTRYTGMCVKVSFPSLAQHESQVWRFLPPVFHTFCTEHAYHADTSVTLLGSAMLLVQLMHGSIRGGKEKQAVYQRSIKASLARLQVPLSNVHQA